MQLGRKFSINSKIEIRIQAPNVWFQQFKRRYDKHLQRAVQTPSKHTPQKLFCLPCSGLDMSQTSLMSNESEPKRCYNSFTTRYYVMYAL